MRIVTQVVMRHLPAGLEGNELLAQMQPLPDYAEFYLAKPDES
jgi:hypothetical protein